MSMVWHCGDPLGEQRAMERGRGIAPLDRDVISVAGADRLNFLHSLTTTSVMGLEPGRGVTTLVLSPTGRIEHVLHGVDDGEAFLAWTEPGAGEPLTAWLNSMRFMLDIDARVRSSQRERFLVSRALRQGRPTPWDHDPPYGAAGRFGEVRIITAARGE